MKSMKYALTGVMMLVVAGTTAPAMAKDYTYSTPGASGYDVVAYFTDGEPMKGSGFHVTVHEGVTYAFASDDHKKLFEANPAKYLPAYGSYCAYGVAVGKKFVADPEVWKIVEGKLYLNLDKDIQSKWNKDIPGHIRKADKNWKTIQDKAPTDL